MKKKRCDCRRFGHDRSKLPFDGNVVCRHCFQDLCQDDRKHVYLERKDTFGSVSLQVKGVPCRG